MKETADVELAPGLVSVRSVPIPGSGPGLALVLIEAGSLAPLPPSVPDHVPALATVHRTSPGTSLGSGMLPGQNVGIPTFYLQFLWNYLHFMQVKI